METFCDGLCGTVREITDDWYFKFTMQCGKVGEMMYLRDRATPDNTYPYTVHKFYPPIGHVFDTRSSYHVYEIVDKETDVRHNRD